MALFFPVPKAGNFAYSFYFKELTLISIVRKLGLFCRKRQGPGVGGQSTGFVARRSEDRRQKTENRIQMIGFVFRIEYCVSFDASTERVAEDMSREAYVEYSILHLLSHKKRRPP